MARPSPAQSKKSADGIRNYVKENFSETREITEVIAYMYSRFSEWHELTVINGRP